jgi:hypothetical protein
MKEMQARSEFSLEVLPRDISISAPPVLKSKYVRAWEMLSLILLVSDVYMLNLGIWEQEKGI